MPIKINRSLFMPSVKERFGDERMLYPTESVDFADDVLYNAQKWMDQEPWKNDPEMDTPRELKISLMRYVKNQIDFKDHKKSWFVPTWVWIMIAQKVLSWLIKEIIEYYFPEIRKEIPKKS